MVSHTIRLIIIALMTVLVASPSVKAEVPKSNDFANQTAEEIKEDIEQKHPASYYILASKLFSDNQKDDAVFWFYVGQLRYRFHLSANQDIDPTGDPALFASLSETIGRSINEYAFGNVPQLANTFDKVLEWDKEQENFFTSKEQYPEQYQAVRAGLEDLRRYILENEAEIKRRREENGLENR